MLGGSGYPSSMALRTAIPRLITLALVLGATAPAQAAPATADRDGDGVFDDLEARVQETPPSQAVRVIVMLESEPSRARVERLEGEVESLDARSRFGLIDAFEAVVDAGEVRELAGENGVATVARDAPVRALNNSAQADFGLAAARQESGLNGGDASDAYSKDDLVAAVIDTGIDAGHLDLNQGKVIGFKDLVNGRTTAYDDQGHGTHVAATIAGDGDASGGTYRGVAPRAALVGVKVLDDKGSGMASDVIAGVQWAVDNRATYGIEVINLSLGTTGCSAGTDPESLAVNSAVAAGLVVVAAAGNEGPGACTIGSPGAASGALTVGAVADTGAAGIYLASFSSRGPTSSGATKPDIVAPGVNITSAAAGSSSGYFTASGTSMAAPFTAGVTLLMLEANPALTPANVKQMLMSAADDRGQVGADSDFGAGLIDPYSSLQAAGATGLTAAPPLPAQTLLSESLSSAEPKDWFALTPEGGKPLAVTLVNDKSDDFDLYLFNASGQLVDLSENPEHGDDLAVLAPNAGPYTVRVERFSGSGPYTLDVSGASSTVVAPSSSDPSQIQAPTISGTSFEGEQLTANPGQWGNGPVAIFYRWIRCEADGTGCTQVATGSTYLLGTADVGKRMKLQVRAINRGGLAEPVTALTDVVQGSPPVNTSPPSISGEAKDGRTLSASPGAWTGTSPITFTYFWRRCNEAGDSCAAIAGATAPTYTLTPADVGSRLQVAVSATNSRDTVTATSAPGPVVGAAPPRNTVAPSIAGAPVLGGTLNGDIGAWSGTQPSSQTIHWLRCDGNGNFCAPIDGATASQYTLAQADVGATIRLRVTASNAGGTAVRESTATDVVTQPPPEAKPPRSLVRPHLEGSAHDGRVLTVGTGSWDGDSPITFDYRWQRCDPGGERCERITGATRRRYVLKRDDIGTRIRARVIAWNAAGTAEARTAPTRRIAPSPPTALVAPRVDGSARRGGLLRAYGGTWWGTEDIRYAVQWLRCSRSGLRCSAIRGERGATYLPTARDRHRRLRVRVRARNAAGVRRVLSGSTAIVRTTPGVAPGRPPSPRYLTVRIAPNPESRAQRATATLPRD